jgi:hypothetical protein
LVILPGYGNSLLFTAGQLQTPLTNLPTMLLTEQAFWLTTALAVGLKTQATDILSFRMV